MFVPTTAVTPEEQEQDAAAAYRIDQVGVPAQAGAPAQAAAPAVPQEEGLDFFKLMGAGGPAPEVINGRAAMVGFLAAVGAELATQDSIFKQLDPGGPQGAVPRAEAARGEDAQ